MGSLYQHSIQSATYFALNTVLQFKMLFGNIVILEKREQIYVHTVLVLSDSYAFPPIRSCLPILLLGLPQSNCQ